MAFKLARLILTLALLSGLGLGLLELDQTAPPAQAASPAAATFLTARAAPLIIDHTTTDITRVPQAWIEAAKQTLHIGYGHTSHGEQLTQGMSGLIAFANGGGKGLALPQDIFQFDHASNNGGAALHIFEGSSYDTSGLLALDVGYSGWDTRTRDYLGTPNANGRGSARPEINVIMWSWCGQVGFSDYASLASHYLTPMSQLELDYPGVTFVYMTGHADGNGETGNVHLRNQDIRNYAIANNKVLFDFYDFDTHDPDGNYYGNQNVDDGCNYTGGNWCTAWQNTHTVGTDWYSVGCSHSQSLNCNQKGYAMWWLWASLAGWNAPANLAGSTKAASQTAATVGDTVTYTVRLVSPAPVTDTVSLSDTLPAGLSYVAGSLTATGGSVDDSQAPVLQWTGVLSPTPVITVTYAAVVTTPTTIWLINTAFIQVEEETPLTRTAMVIANGYSLYLPLIRR